MVSYNPLWHTLLDKGIKPIELCKNKVISSATLSKLNKNEYIALSVVDKICQHLNCTVSQILEVLPDDENNATK